MSDTLTKHKERALLFLESGFIAVNQSDEVAAKKLFAAAELLQPENELIKLGFGYLHLCKLELKKAIECFDTLLKEHPDHEMAKTFKGLALSMTPDGVSAGEKLLTEMAKSKDEQVKNLSTSTLEFVDKYVKQAPSPADLQKPKQK
ncbi:MAG: hypothetical protein MRY21_06750 [Simkaniaceae bacterium]|nr:hypothetical protein [Simkaniaceae bacterium]